MAAGERAALERAQQLRAGLKHRIGVVERDPPGLGEFEAAPDPFEQEVAHLVFKLLDLNRECGLREIHPLGRLCQATVVGDGPEIAEVVEIEIAHIVLLNRTNHQKQ